MDEEFCKSCRYCEHCNIEWTEAGKKLLCIFDLSTYIYNPLKEAKECERFKLSKSFKEKIS